MTQKIKSFQIELDDELLLSSDPINPLGAVTKQYVDTQTAAVGQVSLINSGPDFGVLNNGLFYYGGKNIIPASGSSVITLPIALNNGIKVFFSSGNVSVSFASLSTTQLTLSNSGTIMSYSVWVLIGL